MTLTWFAVDWACDVITSQRLLPLCISIVYYRFKKKKKKACPDQKNPFVHKNTKLSNYLPPLTLPFPPLPPPPPPPPPRNLSLTITWQTISTVLGRYRFEVCNSCICQETCIWNLNKLRRTESPVFPSIFIFSSSSFLFYFLVCDNVFSGCSREQRLKPTLSFDKGDHCAVSVKPEIVALDAPFLGGRAW